MSGADDTMASDGPQLTVYCRPWCGDCRRALAWLDEHDVPYRQVNVDEDADARARAAAHNLGDLHTPTFELGDDVCVDFRPQRLRELLGIE